jgi:predicted metal-dependent phosphoesterase TrpH
MKMEDCMKADLHIHSKFSFDGEQDVATIVNNARKENLDFISITDHNEIAGSLELLKNSSIKSISGIEIDCFDGKIIHHILGYGCDLSNPVFKEIRDHYINELNILTSKRIDMFNKLFSLDLSLKEIEKEYPNKLITNVEITKHMFEHKNHPLFLPYTKGEKRNNPLANFYWDYCAINKPAYIEMDLPSTQHIIDVIHQTGGVAIIAHPMIMGVDLSYYDTLHSIDGIEACSSYHSSQQVQEVLAYAKNRELLITCGSDFHGINKPNISLGQSNIPNDFSDEWLHHLLERIK